MWAKQKYGMKFLELRKIPALRVCYHSKQETLRTKFSSRCSVDYQKLFKASKFGSTFILYVCAQKLYVRASWIFGAF